MNKTRAGVAVIVATVLITIPLITIPLGCFGETDTKDFDFRDFTAISAGAAFQVKITKASNYSITITVDRDKMDKIEVTKVGNRLNIGLKPNTGPLNFSTLEAEITMPDISSLILSGASNGTIQGFSFTHEFSLIVSGASKLSGDLDAGDVTFTLSGASTVDIQGSAGDMAVSAAGASHVRLSSFEVDNADIMLSGASDGTVNMDGTLDADLSGASSLTVRGDAIMGDVNLSGGSIIN
jgi:hypothetical protein